MAADGRPFSSEELMRWARALPGAPTAEDLWRGACEGDQTCVAASSVQFLCKFKWRQDEEYLRPCAECDKYNPFTLMLLYTDDNTTIQDKMPSAPCNSPLCEPPAYKINSGFKRYKTQWDLSKCSGV